MQKSRSTVLFIWVGDDANEFKRPRQTISLSRNDPVSCLNWTQRERNLSKTANFANDPPSSRLKFENSRPWRPNDARLFPFGTDTFCVHKCLVSFSGASRKRTGSRKRSYPDSLRASGATGCLEPRRY